MTKSVYINLPVADLETSMKFYEAIGFANNSAFTDQTAACMVWSETIYVMLLTHDKWRTFTDRPIPPTDSSEVMLCISMESRAAVDAINRKADEHGGTAGINPVQEYGFMYARPFADPDGHVWEPMWMDPTSIPSAKEGEASN